MQTGFWAFFEQIRPQLSIRSAGFEKIFRELDSLDHPPIIVETGCVRRDDSWSSDGSSTRLFDTYAQFRQGTRFITVDNNYESTACAKRNCKVAEIHTDDSVKFLKELELVRVDLFYLDSFDCDWKDPMPSSKHHLEELEAALPMITPETMVVVDDCFYNQEHKQVLGKGILVGEYAKQNNAEPFLLDYQCGWRKMNANRF